MSLKKLWNLLEWEIGNRYTLSLLCAKVGEIHLCLICSILEKILMDGGGECRLNVSAFLRLLRSEHFRNVQAIFIPCGKTKGLFVNDIKRACPSVQTIVHSKWLMMNGSMEEIQEGEGQHPFKRVYRHDMPFTEGTNVWVQFEWDKKFKLVLESLFVAPAFLQKQNRFITSFLRY